MLNTSDNQILYHLSEKFRNSECMEFLTTILDKYNKELSLVHFSKYSYHKNLYGVEIDYNKTEDEETIISVKENNNYIGNLTININKYKNNITIVDNLYYYSDIEKDKTKVIRLAIGKDCTSYVEYRICKNYYSPKKKQLYFSKLIFDPSGNLINYFTDESSSNKGNDIAKNMKKIKM